jgi:hypothetical protein
LLTGRSPSRNNLFHFAMPRLSPEARATLTANHAGKLAPSPHLSATERKTWRTIVGATPAGHLSERDRPLLESYVTLATAQRKLQGLVGDAGAAELLEGKALARIETIGKTLAALSNRLKLAPLATHSAPHKAGQRDEQPRPAPLLGGLARVK